MVELNSGKDLWTARKSVAAPKTQVRDASAYTLRRVLDVCSPKNPRFIFTRSIFGSALVMGRMATGRKTPNLKSYQL